jgi:hypothetical protein
MWMSRPELNPMLGSDRLGLVDEGTRTVTGVGSMSVIGVGGTITTHEDAGKNSNQVSRGSPRLNDFGLMRIRRVLLIALALT